MVVLNTKIEPSEAEFKEMAKKIFDRDKEKKGLFIRVLNDEGELIKLLVATPKNLSQSSKEEVDAQEKKMVLPKLFEDIDYDKYEIS